MSPPPSRFPWLLAVLASGLAALFLLQATRSGLLMDDDSFTYLESSKNIAAGHGYVFAIPPDPVAPITHFPPLHPAVLAVLQTLIHDDLQAARRLEYPLPRDRGRAVFLDRLDSHRRPALAGAFRCTAFGTWPRHG